MKQVLVPLADGFEEIEAVTVVGVLRRAGLSVTVAGIREGVLSGSRKISLSPDTVLSKVQVSDFDAVVVPGGQPGVNHLKADARLLAVVREMLNADKLVGMICAAPLVLKELNLHRGKKITSHPSVQTDLKDSKYSEERVVWDGNLITSRGPGTAMEFSLEMVEKLAGKAKRDELAKAMLVK